MFRHGRGALRIRARLIGVIRAVSTALQVEFEDNSSVTVVERFFYLSSGILSEINAHSKVGGQLY